MEENLNLICDKMDTEIEKVDDERLKTITKVYDLNNCFSGIKIQLENLEKVVENNHKKNVSSLDEFKINYFEKFNTELDNVKKELSTQYLLLQNNFFVKLDRFEYLDSRRFQLENENMALNDELNKLSKAKSTTIYCVMKDVENFFKNDNYFASKPTEFLNIKWSILIQSNCIKDGERYLSYYLKPINEIDDENNVNWQCKTHFELRLKSNLTDKSDYIKQFEHTFTQSIAAGCDKFISANELFDLRNRLVENDSIKMEIRLKVDEIERNI